MIATWLAYNTLVVLAGVAAVGFAAGVVGSLAVLRKRPLVGDAAAHATLAGVAIAFLLTGRRDLATLLAGGLVSALAGLITLVLVRRYTKTRDDAATAIVIGVSFGIGIALVAGITARAMPGSAGLEQFLLGHTAALTARDATLLAAASLLAVVVVVVALKEAVVVAFDADFAAATGWPVGLIDVALVTLVAVMVVVGLPAAGAVLVTALVVIPPVAARQWTQRVGTMLLLAGVFGLTAAVVGVAISSLRPGLATGPLVVLAAAAICVGSFLAAPERGWLTRRRQAGRLAGVWARGRVLEECLDVGGDDGRGGFAEATITGRAGGDGRRAERSVRRAWEGLVRDAAVVPVGHERDTAGLMRLPVGGRDLWTLSAAGLAEARDRRLRIAAWHQVLDVAAEAGRAGLSLDLPDPADVLDPATLARVGSLANHAGDGATSGAGT